MLHIPERVNIVKCARWVWINILTTCGLVCSALLGDPPHPAQPAFAGRPLPTGLPTAVVHVGESSASLSYRKNNFN